MPVARRTALRGEAAKPLLAAICPNAVSGEQHAAARVIGREFFDRLVAERGGVGDQTF